MKKCRYFCHRKSSDYSTRNYYFWTLTFERKSNKVIATVYWKNGKKSDCGLYYKKEMDEYIANGNWVEIPTAEAALMI